MNITLLTNATDIVQWGQVIDKSSNGSFGLVVLIIIYSIIYISMIRWGSKVAFSIASVIGALSAGFLWLMSWINNDLILFIAIALAVVGVLIRYYEGKGD